MHTFFNICRLHSSSGNFFKLSQISKSFLVHLLKISYTVQSCVFKGQPANANANLCTPLSWPCRYLLFLCMITSKSVFSHKIIDVCVVNTFLRIFSVCNAAPCTLQLRQYICFATVTTAKSLFKLLQVKHYSQSQGNNHLLQYYKLSNNP